MIKRCYYLNLDRRPDRKEFIENQLNKSELLKNIYERVPAVDGSLVHPRYVEKGLLSSNAIDDILQETATAWGLSITQGGLGIILSYIDIFKKIKSLDNPAMIIEDDTILPDDFDAKFAQALSELPSDFDILYLGYGDTKVNTKSYSKNLSIPIGYVSCTPAMVVSAAGADMLLKYLKNMDNQLDTAMSLHFEKMKVFLPNTRIVQIPNTHGSDIQGDVNCRKKYKKQNYIFTTLVRGEKYITQGLLLAKDLEHFDQKLLVVTDQPEAFSNSKNVTTVKYNTDVFSYNDKIICIEEGFKYADAVVYMDCDCRILYNTYKNTMSTFSLIISPGFHPGWDWGLINRPDNKFFQSKDINGRVEGYGELALQLCKELGIDYTKAMHYQEGMFIISKENGKEKVLLDTWKALAEKLDAHEIKNGSERIGVGEGNILGLALVKSEMTINSVEVCNTLGESIKYNCYGNNMLHQLTLAKDRKMVESSGLKEIHRDTRMVKFEDKEVALEYTVYDGDEGMGSISFKWNQNDAVNALDHEFKINETVYHFQSEKFNQFYFKKSDKLTISHTYDWYGERNWETLL
jgi:GR25 family glycosyltransferase involved in LPS biosynthesis